MNKIVFIENGKVFTDSLILAEKFGKEHKNVLADIENQIDKLGEANEKEFSRLNFQLSYYINDRGRKYPKYDLTEDAFAIVAMSYITPEAMKMKVRFIEEFKLMRQQLSGSQIPQSLPEALRLAATLAEERDAMQLQADRDKPKVLFADAVAASKSCILVGELAKILKQNGFDIGQNRFFEWLRDNGYLICRKGTDYNMPTQRAMDLELFEIKESTINHSDGHITVNKTPKVTGKGQMYFVNKFEKLFSE